MALSILIIDDEHDIGWSYKKALEDHGMDVRFTVSPEEGLMMMRFSPDIVLLDFKMPVMNGIEVLRRIRGDDPNQIVIMMTGFGNVENAVEAMKLGAFHYIQKPFEVEELLPFLYRAKEVIDMRRMLNLSESIIGKGNFGYLDGKSPVMKEVFKRAKKVSDKSSTSILILGESGTGKEMLARTIHDLSGRGKQLFVAMNCSAIPETLLESELFGYEPGAFTGATRRKRGLFEVADNGTLFLDEIGDMALALQSKILRVLESGTFNRLGADRDEIKVDVRIIAASNQPLEKMINAGTFREDLFYRLNRYTIEMPPLKDRGEDILELAMKFVSRFNEEMKTDIKGLTPEAARAIKTFDWPGNVRQLKNAIESAMIECESDQIRIEDLPITIRTGGSKRAARIADSFAGPVIPSLDEVKNAYIIKVLGQCRTDQEAADLLNISRRSITRFKKEILDNPPNQVVR